jgi:hypothetical protein
MSVVFIGRMEPLEKMHKRINKALRTSGLRQIDQLGVLAEVTTDVLVKFESGWDEGLAVFMMVLRQAKGDRELGYSPIED